MSQSRLTKILKLAFIIHTLILISFFVEVASLLTYEESFFAGYNNNQMNGEYSLLRQMIGTHWVEKELEMNIKHDEIAAFMYSVELEVFQLIGILIM